jgi:hypothetical protein
MKTTAQLKNVKDITGITTGITIFGALAIALFTSSIWYGIAFFAVGITSTGILYSKTSKALDRSKKNDIYKARIENLVMPPIETREIPQGWPPEAKEKLRGAIERYDSYARSLSKTKADLLEDVNKPHLLAEFYERVVENFIENLNDSARNAWLVEYIQEGVDHERETALEHLSDLGARIELLQHRLDHFTKGKGGIIFFFPDQEKEIKSIASMIKGWKEHLSVGDPEIFSKINDRAWKTIETIKRTVKEVNGAIKGRDHLVREVPVLKSAFESVMKNLDATWPLLRDLAMTPHSHLTFRPLFQRIELIRNNESFAKDCIDRLWAKFGPEAEGLKENFYNTQDYPSDRYDYDAAVRKTKELAILLQDIHLAYATMTAQERKAPAQNDNQAIAF